MSASNALETALLALLFNNTAAANIGDASGLQPSATAGNFYIALHTADPGEAGAQNTSEVAYTGYARQPVARSGAGFTVSGNTVSNAAAVAFGLDTVGSATATHFSIGTAVSGAGHLLYSAQLDAPFGIAPTVNPTFAIGALAVVAD